MKNKIQISVKKNLNQREIKSVIIYQLHMVRKYVLQPYTCMPELADGMLSVMSVSMCSVIK